MATVASTPRTKSYTLAADSAGPFSIGYRLFDTVSVNVYVDDVLQTGWTVQATFVNGYDDNATVTPPATVLSGSVVRIETWMETGRAADFVPGDPSLTGNLNIDVARAWALLGDHDRELRRSLRGVSDINPAALSKSSILTIDANGKLVSGTGTIALANLPSYASWAVLDAAAGLKDGQLVIISNGQLGSPETVKIVAAGTYSADGVLVRNLTASGLQAVSTRQEYASYAEAKGDPRLFTSGYWSMSFGASGQYVTTGDNWGTTTAGGSKLLVEWGDVRAWGVVPATAAPSDYTTEFQSALNNFGKVYLPDGEYKVSSLQIPNNAEIVGTGLYRPTIYMTGAQGITTPAESRNIKLQGFILNNSNAAATAGIYLTQAHGALIDRVYVLGNSATAFVAYVIDGATTFAASNTFFDPWAGDCYMGMQLKANTGKQVNHTRVFGGYFYGNTTIKGISGSTGMQILNGDTNYVYGLGVETFDVGFDMEATDPGGCAIFPIRIEACNTDYKFNPSASNVTVFAPGRALTEVDFGGSGDGGASYGVAPYFQAQNIYLPNNSLLRAKDSGGTFHGIIGATTNDDLNIVIPSYSTAKVINLIDGSDGTTMASFGHQTVTMNRGVTAKPLAFGSLPASPALWEQYICTDPNTVTFGASVTAGGGGLGAVPVRWNGSAWQVG